MSTDQSIATNGNAPNNLKRKKKTTKAPPPDVAISGAAKAKAIKQNPSVATGPSELFLNKAFATYAQLGYHLPWEILDYVELLAIYNPDYSQAVDNNKSLANSGHELMVDGSKLQVNKTKDLLEEKARTIQYAHGGIDGLIDKLLWQASVYGAMCGEAILNEDGTDVIDFIDVNPKSIRFFWEDEHWAPYQKVTGNQAREAENRGQTVRNNNCIKLNELTFSYFSFDSMSGNPYGVPPFIAALQNIAIQEEMTDNMSQIVKKVGLLGIIDLSIRQPNKKAGESDEQYEARAGKYLDDYVVVVEEMVRDGGLVHFDDVNVSSYNITGNAQGATNIFKQNEELIFSGLKSMPSLHGRTYSTSETYAGVAYDIMIRNSHKYQRAAKRMIENLYWLIVSINGLQPTSITLQFAANKALNRLQDAQAETLEIRNAAMLWLSGIVDQTGYAQLLGYSNPKEVMEEPPPALYGASQDNLNSGTETDQQSANDGTQVTGDENDQDETETE